ncbi:hypothetical protein [Methanosphaera sp. WGK6]|uniref:hypothetical protein n=1 Tax=Methanosphaera sp. WGK6 TaxID=1561964 RepID=UPI001300EEFF|nr:hypothetical protein [Methanosphaera sp. WGK6]
MFESIKRNKIQTLEPKKSIINNDIDIGEYSLIAAFTLIAVPTIFLICTQLMITIGYL